MGELRTRLNTSREHVIELRREIAVIEREIVSTTRLLSDLDIEATAKRAIAGALAKLLVPETSTCTDSERVWPLPGAGNALATCRVPA